MLFWSAYSKSRVVEMFSAAHMTCLWPKVTHSPDCIATVSIWPGWQWRTGAWETMAYLTQADIANLSSIRGSLISAHGMAVSFLLPHGQIRHNADPKRGHKSSSSFTVTEIRITLNWSQQHPVFVQLIISVIHTMLKILRRSLKVCSTTVRDVTFVHTTQIR